MVRKAGVCVSAVLVVLVMVPARVVAAAAGDVWSGACRSWVRSPSPDAGTGDNDLYGVTALSARDAWAIGGDNGGALIEHWNGTRWSATTVP